MITQYALTYEPRLFLALLGKAPDGVHFANYAYAFEANQPLKDIANWMYYDYQPANYPSSMTHAQIAAKFYTNIYGHAPTSAAIAPWVARLDAWESPSSVMVDMIAALVDYKGSDSATLQSQALFNNKVAVSVYYASYGGNELGTSAVLQGVTSDPSTVLAAIHAMKGHYNIPANAPDPEGSAPAPDPSPVAHTGTVGNDSFGADSGNDAIDGLAGDDTVVYASALANFTVHRSGDSLVVTDRTGALGTDTLTHVEHLRFSDKTVNTQVAALAQQLTPAQLKGIVELYVAFFNRVPDGDGMAYWIAQVQGGLSLDRMADAFYAAGVQNAATTGYSAAMSNADFVNVVYRNALGRDSADAQGLDYWTKALASGSETRGSLVEAILESAHTFKGNAQWGWVADLLDNKFAVGKQFAVDMGLNFNTPQASITEGIKIAHAVTPTGTDAALALIGVAAADVTLA